MSTYDLQSLGVRNPVECLDFRNSFHALEMPRSWVPYLVGRNAIYSPSPPNTPSAEHASPDCLVFSYDADSPTTFHQLKDWYARLCTIYGVVSSPVPQSLRLLAVVCTLAACLLGPERDTARLPHIVVVATNGVGPRGAEAKDEEGERALMFCARIGAEYIRVGRMRRDNFEDFLSMKALGWMRRMVREGKDPRLVVYESRRLSESFNQLTLQRGGHE